MAKRAPEANLKNYARLFVVRFGIQPGASKLKVIDDRGNELMVVKSVDEATPER